MNIENQHTLTQYPPTPDQNVVEYQALVDTVQLSVARKLGIEKSIAAKTFEQLTTHYSESERETVITEIGVHFDDELIRFVVGSLMGREEKETIILAEETEGVEGHLPWESKLMNHIALLQERGLLEGVSLKVSRYAAELAPIEYFSDHTQVPQNSPLQQNHAA